MVQVQVPPPLRSYTQGAATLDAEGSTVGEVLRAAVTSHTGLRSHLFTPEGQLRSSVTVYLNDEDIRYLAREKTSVTPNDVVAIVPALAGGSVRDSSSPAASAPAEGGSAPLDRDELRRYSRHLLLPEVGVAGQKKLRDSRVLLVGAGGLGAPSALYLAAAGVGTIGLVDFDRVDVTNLQRQVLYGTRDLGRPKLDAAQSRLNDLNPHVRVEVHSERLTSENALTTLKIYDVVVDGTDNFPTRYLVNDACVLLGKPNVYGSIYRFEGQATVFDARHGPCYRCLYPEPPPPGQVPSCAEAGVLGVLPGIIGMIQATETVKLILGLGESLTGRLVLYDALSMSFRELKVRKDPNCVLCGPHATQTGLIDYPAFCGVTPADAGAPGVPDVTPEALAAELETVDPPLLLDVREPGEWEINRIPGATLIPRGELPERVTELTRARGIVVYCHTGARSSLATRFLLDLGFTHVRNLRGGIDAWAERVDPSVPRY